MKRLLVAVCLLSMVGVASTQAQNYIGIFADEPATICYADWPSGGSVDIYFAAIIDPVEINGVAGAEFRVEGLPEGGPPNLFVTPDWYGLVISDSGLGYALSIALDEAGAGPVVPLGTINYFVNGPIVIGDNEVMSVEPTLDFGKLQIADIDYTEIPVSGGMFTWNCTDPPSCGCIDTPTATTSWSSIKSIY